MKILFLTLLFNNIGVSNTMQMLDSGKKYNHSINMEVGHSTSIFIDKNIDFSVDNNGNSYKPTFFKLTYQVAKHLTFSFDYKNYFSINYPLMNQPGIYIEYNAFDLSGGYLITSKTGRFRFLPYISLSARPSGTEYVLLKKYYPFGNNAIYHIYRYNSKGFGLGVDAQVVLFNHFTLGGEVQYNYFFEQKDIRSDIAYGWEEYHKNYKVNRQMVTPVFKLGYLIKY